MSEILLDSSIGEMELLEFVVNSVHFGINVAKVQEIVVHQRLTSIPNSKKGVLGMTLIRNDLYSVLDLKAILYDISSEIDEKTYFILCNFNQQHTAFVVDDVIGIRRVAWSEMKKPSDVINGENGTVVGIINTDKEIISVLDFEKIVTDIHPNSGLKIDVIQEADTTIIEKRSRYTVLIADDSKMIRKMLIDTISSVGYKTISVEDGEQAFNTYKLSPNLDLAVLDIEMPTRDGLEVARLIREENQEFPIIIFSSLINTELNRKIQKLNVDTITKPELPLLIERIDSILLKGKN